MPTMIFCPMRCGLCDVCNPMPRMGEVKFVVNTKPEPDGKPDCCDAMRSELKNDNGVRFCRRDELPDGYSDVGGAPLYGLETKEAWATWIMTAYEGGWYGEYQLNFTRIRFCPWCGERIDPRDMLE